MMSAHTPTDEFAMPMQTDAPITMSPAEFQVWCFRSRLKGSHAKASLNKLLNVAVSLLYPADQLGRARVRRYLRGAHGINVTDGP
jgi:hypothetical protein